MGYPYGVDLFSFTRLTTKPVNIGHLTIGHHHPIRVQTMLTTDTMDTEACVSQAIRCIEAGSELIRITAPSKKESENLFHIKKQLRARGFNTPLVADIHYTPNAAEIAAEIVEKVRINPGNYIDKKKFEFIEYSDSSYQEEVEKIKERFLKLISICQKHHTAIRIGTNHGSLSDRIMSYYGDTAVGMVESAMEFIRISRAANFHQLVVSMKASNTQVMVAAYRLVVKTMLDEFGEVYPLHLGITEAGDGEDGRIKSAVGMGSLLMDGLGDTIRVSLTEDPEFEIPVCQTLVGLVNSKKNETSSTNSKNTFIDDSFSYQRKQTNQVGNIGNQQVPVVITDLRKEKNIDEIALRKVGHFYDEKTDKWTLGDLAADYIYIGEQNVSVNLLPALGVVVDYPSWKKKWASKEDQFFPIFEWNDFLQSDIKHPKLNFVRMNMQQNDSLEDILIILKKIPIDPSLVFCLLGEDGNYTQSLRKFYTALRSLHIKQPTILFSSSSNLKTEDEEMLYHSTNLGSLLIDGQGDGIFIDTTHSSHYWGIEHRLAFGILQAVRTRITKTEYISCPSCGRTLFDLQSTTQKIRSATGHLKGLKIAVMGCIVNGPGEMADADYGYVGSGVGKISLYKGKEVIKRNIPSEVAVQELIELIKSNNDWIDVK